MKKKFPVGPYIYTWLLHRKQHFFKGGLRESQLSFMKDLSKVNFSFMKGSRLRRESLTLLITPVRTVCNKEYDNNVSLRSWS